MVDAADRVSVESRDDSTVALQLRAAFKLCPTCSAKSTVGKATQGIFYLDEYVLLIFNSLFVKCILSTAERSALARHSDPAQASLAALLLDFHLCALGMAS